MSEASFRIIGLAEMVIQLRAKLKVAIAKGEDKDLRFNATGIELESMMTAGRTIGESGRLNFCVLGLVVGAGSEPNIENVMA